MLGLAESAGEPAPTTDNPSLRALTRREREVALLFAEGLTNRQFAERLVIAKRTVDTHVQNIPAKLRCASRSQIAVRVSTSA